MILDCLRYNRQDTALLAKLEKKLKPRTSQRDSTPKHCATQTTMGAVAAEQANEAHRRGMQVAGNTKKMAKKTNRGWSIRIHQRNT